MVLRNGIKKMFVYFKSIYMLIRQELQILAYYKINNKVYLVLRIRNDGSFYKILKWSLFGSKHNTTYRKGFIFLYLKYDEIAVVLLTSIFIALHLYTSK